MEFLRLLARGRRALGQAEKGEGGPLHPSASMTWIRFEGIAWSNRHLSSSCCAPCNRLEGKAFEEESQGGMGEE